MLSALVLATVACTTTTAVPAWAGLAWDIPQPTYPAGQRLAPRYELWWRHADSSTWVKMAELPCAWGNYCDPDTMECWSVWLCPGEAATPGGHALVAAPPLRYGTVQAGRLIRVTVRAVGCQPVPCTEDLLSELPVAGQEMLVPAPGANVAEICWPSPLWEGGAVMP